MRIEEIQEAVDSDHKASTVLKNVLLEVAENLRCPQDPGSDTPSLIYRCEEPWCMHCIAYKFKENLEANN